MTVRAWQSGLPGTTHEERQASWPGWRAYLGAVGAAAVPPELFGRASVAAAELVPLPPEVQWADIEDPSRVVRPRPPAAGAAPCSHADCVARAGPRRHQGADAAVRGRPPAGDGPACLGGAAVAVWRAGTLRPFVRCDEVCAAGLDARLPAAIRREAEAASAASGGGGPGAVATRYRLSVELVLTGTHAYTTDTKKTPCAIRVTSKQGKLLCSLHPEGCAR